MCEGLRLRVPATLLAAATCAQGQLFRAPHENGGTRVERRLRGGRSEDTARALKVTAANAGSIKQPITAEDAPWRVGAAAGEPPVAAAYPPTGIPASACPLLGDVGFTTASGTDEYSGLQLFPGENIYGPFENGRLRFLCLVEGRGHLRLAS